MRSVLIFGFACLASLVSAQSRVSDEMRETEEMLLASTKQVNQFFRRFNGEESEAGERYYPKDREYRSASLRRKYLPALFDQESSGINEGTARDFLKEITDKKSPGYLDFHSGDWFAEVATTFSYKGKKISGLLYLRLQAQGQGYAWVIDDVAIDALKEKMEKDPDDHSYFIHPMSHELDFMTFRKAFQPEKNAAQYTAKEYEPDYLSIFLYEINQGDLKYQSVTKVTFHFFSLENWYFSVSNFNRPGYNTGWLISNLVPLQDEQQKAQMKAYIYDKN